MMLSTPSNFVAYIWIGCCYSGLAAHRIVNDTFSFPPLLGTCRSPNMEPRRNLMKTHLKTDVVSRDILCS